ncbi:response regulator transcription factor [Alteribacillus iranensis]|uniref:DNA-binding response regulator, OmpR family, contains REC and winged-helix (WHTH) domain n=1 Tax=Alteribacillus iranensis TaxID=930128 RepID=A0A1I2D2X0_9BACI|nr:response regulator transcription factor [Alteribacillus iranensis]SFE74868.1 DNA-binding response regulator, OmpR family, contains REC and winged-helix (wHTH) domain [Alteribacillus iranensis]
MSLGSVLIVEDEEKLARVLALELEYEGYDVCTVHHGRDGYHEALSGEHDLVLLDVMLPEMSGLEILRRLRKEDESTPVILLTARGEVPDKVSGLDLGANDYVTKPFEIEELLARIRAHLRSKKTTGEEKQETIQVGDLQVTPATREIYRGQLAIEMTPREFDLLLYLMKNKNLVLTREQILEDVWGFDYMGDTNVVDVYIRYVRKKIDKPFSTPLIHTVRGVGYSMKGS